MPRRDVLLPVCVALSVLALGAAAAMLNAPTRWVVLGIAAVLVVIGAVQWGASRHARLVRMGRQVRGLLRAEPGSTAGASDMDGAPWPSLRPGADALDRLEDALEELDARVRRQVKDLAKNSRNLMALIDGLDMPVLATGSDGGVILCNRAAESVVGLGPGQMLGRSVSELFTRRELIDLHSGARAGASGRAQVTLTTPAGARTFQASATPLPAAWGEGVFGAILVLRDVTDLAQAVALKTDFVASASHELRTPVAALRAAVETLQGGADDDAAMRARLHDICARHVERLEEMIRDLLDLSRLETPDVPLDLRAVNIADLVAREVQTIDDACAQRGLRIDVRLEPAGEPLRVRTDARLLGVIVRNLADNASKFAYDDTTITVRARRIGDGLLRIEVRDRGVGIPLAQQDRVFERFYQVDPARSGFAPKRGTGLGLAIVKHAAKALGGQVGLESVWGEGTTVWVEIPAGMDDADHADTDAPAEPLRDEHAQGAGPRA